MAVYFGNVIGAPNVCKNEADYIGAGQSACEQLGAFLGGFREAIAQVVGRSLTSSSFDWGNVTDSVCNANNSLMTRAPDGETALENSLFRLRSFASKCCGAPDKIRCGFGGTMCKVATDFKPEAEKSFGGGPYSCGEWSDQIYAWNKKSWNDADMCSFLGTSTKKAMEQYGACCGGLDKVRCTDAKQAPADSKFFFTITVTMPYSKLEFDADKQSKYKTSVAAAAGTIETNIDLVNIKEKRRRAGSVDVETKVSNRQAYPMAVPSGWVTWVIHHLKISKEAIGA